MIAERYFADFVAENKENPKSRVLHSNGCTTCYQRLRLQIRGAAQPRHLVWYDVPRRFGTRTKRDTKASR